MDAPGSYQWRRTQRIRTAAAIAIVDAVDATVYLRIAEDAAHQSRTPVPAIALILEIKDSTAGCRLGCPHSDEEYPRESRSRRRQRLSRGDPPKGPATQPDEPLDTASRDPGPRFQSHTRRSLSASMYVATVQGEPAAGVRSRVRLLSRQRDRQLGDVELRNALVGGGRCCDRITDARHPRAFTRTGAEGV
jgi:hypothetical protein